MSLDGDKFEYIHLENEFSGKNRPEPNANV